MKHFVILKLWIAMHLTCHFTIPVGPIFSVSTAVKKVKQKQKKNQKIHKIKKNHRSWCCSWRHHQLGCYCDKNYILNRRTGRCQKAKEYYCGPNSHLSCGDAKCAKFCGSTRDYICDLSAFKCGYSCFCNDGYIKITNGGCIPDVLCPRVLIQQNFDNE